MDIVHTTPCTSILDFLQLNDAFAMYDPKDACISGHGIAHVFCAAGGSLCQYCVAVYREQDIYEGCDARRRGATSSCGTVDEAGRAYADVQASVVVLVRLTARVFSLQMQTVTH